jgi:hypothetical protein
LGLVLKSACSIHAKKSSLLSGDFCMPLGGPCALRDSASDSVCEHKACIQTDKRPNRRV